MFRGASPELRCLITPTVGLANYRPFGAIARASLITRESLLAKGPIQ